jgi:Fe-S oxidoreductase
VLYVEYFADTQSPREELEEKFQHLRARVPADAIKTYTEPGPMLQAWKLRKAGEPLLHGVPGRRKPVTFVEDNAVPPERLGEFVRKFRAIVESHGTKAAFWAHASVGVLHVRPFIDVKDDTDRARMVAIAQEVAELARSVGGVMSGEHGDGRVRGPLLESFYGPEIMGAFREIKALFDPKGLLNPGNIVEPRPVASIAEKLRVAPLEPSRPAIVPKVETYFSYEDQHGFDGAVEMCNGAGICRKKSGGTMCPSYMGTLDERHSTRGRGNALRLAITGQLNTDGTDAPAWNDPETIKTLDLCLSCKACKSECPSNVDIARLKAEFTAQRYKREEPPLATRILSQARRLGWLATRTPALANAVNNSTLGRRMINRVLGFHPKRSIPAFATPLPVVLRRAGIRAVRRPSGTRPAIALFGDCFAMFNEPGIGHAAARVLTRLGYEIVLADVGCCARPAISLGLLDEAIATADRTIANLRPLIESESVRAIVVFEPSCLSAFKDDWMKLKLTSPVELRRALASKSMLVEDFIDKAWDQHPAIVANAGASDGPFAEPARARWRDPALGPVLLHAHCHQKSLWGAETSARLLARFVGPRLRVLDSGCCGMAGAFGYAHDRYDLSMKIGELSLFPAVREATHANAAPGGVGDGAHVAGMGEVVGAIIVAPGTSCRHQIHDGTAQSAIHPIELIDRMLSQPLAP